MVDLSVKGLQVIGLETGRKYTVYALVANDTDIYHHTYFLVYDEELRKKNKGFGLLDVTRCRPATEKVGLVE